MYCNIIRKYLWSAVFLRIYKKPKFRFISTNVYNLVIFKPYDVGLIANRTAIGFVVGLMGFLTVHPLFGFPLPSFFRGFMTGIFISLTLAIGATMGGNSEPMITFWILTIAGGIIGMIIDIIVTKFIGQGSDLYETK